MRNPLMLRRNKTAKRVLSIVFALVLIFACFSPASVRAQEYDAETLTEVEDQDTEVQSTEGENAAADSEDGISLAATTENITLNVGAEKTINLSVYRNQPNVTSTNSDVATASVSSTGGGYGPGAQRSYTLTITARQAGTTTVTVGQGYNQRTYYVTVSGKVKVYVYVAAKDESGNPFSQEMLDLLGVSYVDDNGYFPAGEIELDASFFNGKSNANTEGQPLINTQNDWKALMSALGALNTSSANQTKNKGNKVGDYISQAAQDMGAGWGSQKTALFRWHHYPTYGSSHFCTQCNGDATSYGFGDQQIGYHLDLRFSTNKIVFRYGNNGLPTDNSELDKRVYITNSEIQAPTNGIKIPQGYTTDGKYYKDVNCTEEYTDLIGSEINSDITVYVKITPKDNVWLYYRVAQGQGIVSPGSEALNPDNGVATGSTATAAGGWELEGWYSDKSCTQKLSGDANYVPTKPEKGWVDGTTYYAKFVRSTTSVKITKKVTGNMGDLTKDFSFTVKVTSADDSTADAYTFTQGTTPETVNLGTDKTFTLQNDGSVTLTGIPVGSTVTVEETSYSDSKYETSYTVDGGNKTTATKAEITNIAKLADNAAHEIVFTNNKEATPDVGITLDSRPYLFLGAVVLAGVAILGMSRRRRSDW